jgi:sugar phosphate isomerase/epimerase
VRFGLMSMQLGELLDGVGSAEEAAARVAAFDHAAHVRRLADRGFDPIELSYDLALFLPDAFAPANVERLAALKQERGLGYTCHLPLWSVEPSTPLEPVRRGSVEATVEAIRATLPLAPGSYVLHATNALASEFYRRRLPGALGDFVLGRFQENARRSLREILDRTGIPSRRIAIETVEFPFELTLALAEELDVSICLDVGHVLVGYSGPIDLFEALERSLPRLGQIHLHDAPWQGPEHRVVFGKDHQPLGAGDLDLPRLLDRLAAAGFDGPLVFELSVDQALASLDVVRAVRPELVSNPSPPPA